MTKKLPTFEIASELLYYDANTGKLFWRVKRTCGRGRVFAEAGTEAGSIDISTGYSRISINYAHCYAHRLAWLLTHKVWPSGDIDHINGDRADNRIVNLRDVPHRINLQNRRKAQKNSASGVIGVHKVPSGRWKAIIQAPTGKIHIGTFDTLEQASEARLAAQRKFHDGCTI